MPMQGQLKKTSSSGLARTAALLGGFALFSRLLGLARDMSMAWLLGGGAAADALVAAMRLPHVLRRLLGEGSLSMTLTASLVHLQQGHGPYAGRHPEAGSASAREPWGFGLRLLARALSLRLGMVLLLMTLLGLAAAPWLARFLAPGFSEPELEHTVVLLRICLPYVLAAGMAALGMALLHSMGVFWLPALSPALFNLVMLIAAAAAALHLCPPAEALALGMLCGGLAQWLAQWIAVRRLLPSGGSRVSDGHSNGTCVECSGDSSANVDAKAVNGAAWRCLALLPGGVLGAAAPQLAMLAAMALASELGRGQVAALYYAERLLELPLGLVGVCLGMASLPTLSRLAAEKDFVLFGSHLSTSLRLTVMLSLPAAAGLWAVGPQLVDGLLGHGAFDSQASRETGLALLAYVPGLPAFACIRSLLAACNALGLVRRTAQSSLWAVGGTVVAGLALTRFFEPQYSVMAPALAVSLGLWFQCALLFCLLRRTLPEQKNNAPAPALHGKLFFLPSWLPGWKDLGRHALAGALTGIVAQVLVCLTAPWGLWASLGLAILGGVLVWVLCLRILRDPDMALMMGRLRRKPRPHITDGNA